MSFDVSIATEANVSSLADCAELFAAEAGDRWAQSFDRKHAEQHMHRLVVEGRCFIATRDETVVGLIACVPIDTGFAKLPDLETAHIYVRAGERSSAVIFEMFKAVEAYATSHGVKVLFHQVNYPAAIDARPSNGDRVETLFKRRRYDGPIDIVYAVPDYTRVGLTYLFDGKKAAGK